MNPEPTRQEGVIEQLVNKHQREAEESFASFKQSVITDITVDLTAIETELKKKMTQICKKLIEKLRNSYTSGSLKTVSMNFLLQPYVAKEKEDVTKAVLQLKRRIYDYLNNFSSQVLERNIQKFNEMSLFHFENKIKHVFNEWYSVTSRCPLDRAEIQISGLRRPETSWLALGVCKKAHEYAPLKKGINHEQFLGNIYLNGSQNILSDHKLKKDLMVKDVFVIENINRTIFVYRRTQGRNVDEAFILDDNTKYYFYVGMKGVITIEFRGS